MKHKPKIEGDETIDWNEYEEIPRKAIMFSNVLVDVWEKMGKPPNPFTDTGSKVMETIIKVWERGYPQEAAKWYEDRNEYQINEMSISEQVSQGTGRSLASYPLPIYSMMKKLFPTFDPAERNNCMKMVKRWPMFRMANKV